MKAFPEIFAKRGWMGNGQADVFIQVKKCHRLPGNVRFGQQRIQHLELRGAGRHNDIGFAAYSMITGILTSVSGLRSK